MNRRNFVINSFWVSNGLLFLPSPNWANILLGEDTQFYPLEAYQKGYQDLLNNGVSVAEATREKLEPGALGTSSGWVKTIGDTLKGNGLYPTTPPIGWKQTPKAVINDGDSPRANQGQITKVKNSAGVEKEAGIFLGPKKITPKKGSDLQHEGTSIYVVHPAFLMYTQLQEYFCYGRPSSIPITTTCKYCGQEYHHQKFYYEGDSVYDRKEHPFWSNSVCTQHPSTNSFGQRVHDGIPTNIKLGDILPCKLKVASPCLYNSTMQSYKK
jgi:formylmethanofuran dehydrogenase subunit D